MYSAAVIAVECAAVFSDGIQNNSNSGELIFGSGSKVTNSPDNILDSKNAIDDISGGVSCDSTTCSSSGSIASAVTYNDFPNSSDDISVAFEQTQSISPGNYNNITLASSATLNLAEGDYTVEGSLAVGSSSSINISGKVRIFVKNTINFNSPTSINAGGTATDLLLYAKEDFNILSSATVTAFVYSKQDVTINSSATVNGAVSGRNVELVSASTVNFISDEPDFGDFCEGTPATVFSCDADDSMSVIFNDDFSTTKNWQAVNFDRNISNWTSESIRDSSGEEQDIIFDINSKLNIAGNAQSGSHNEYGMVSYELSNESIDSSASVSYSLYSEMDADKANLNNDLGMIFGYKDDQNYYLAKWNKYGSSYSSNTSFPGAYRSFELVKVESGTATSLDNQDNIDLGDNFSMKVVVQSEGIAVCTGDSDGSNMQLQLSSTEQPPLNDFGLFSYDNDDGISIDNVEIRCDDCLPLFDHFEISHDGQGLTCEAENITIKACADAACTSLSTDDIDVQLSINGTFNKTVTVSGGSTDSSFSYTDASTATLSLDQSYECANGGSTSCDVVFADTGFRFYADSEGTSIPTQLSGKPSNTGFNTRTLKLQAVKKDPLEGDCDAALTDSVIVELSASCKNPNACLDGEAVTINSLSTDTVISTQNDGAAAVYTDVAMNFGTNVDNAAEFVFTYPEAGQMQLHARYNILDENGDPSGVYMEGSSNNFVVRPLGFYVNVANNPKAQDATGTKFIAAGEDFATSLTAVQWQSEEDDNDGSADGIPDDDADLSSHTITKNFGNESAAEAATAEIEKGLVAPSSGSLDNTVKYSFTSFVNGVATNSAMTYDEVGIISFTATAASYLGADDVIGKAPYVGRFIPHHFELSTGFDGELKSVCDITDPSSEMAFAYSGQMSSELSAKGALQYELEPELLITAKSALCSDDVCSTTKNYTGDFIKLLPSGVVHITPTEDTEKDGVEVDGVPRVKVKLTANLTEGTLPEESNGVITYAFNADDNFIYLREQNAEIEPFPAKIALGIDSVEDSDSVLAIDGDDDADNDRLWVLNLSGEEVRFARANLENSFGPETSTLGQVLTIEYYDGANFVLADTDNCTQYNSTNVSFGSPNEVTLDSDDIPAVSGTFIDTDDLANGVTRQIVLPAAGAGNQGEVEVIYSIYDWLKYDWAYDAEGIDGLYNDDPRAIATFGLFRGNDRIIYQREVH